MAQAADFETCGTTGTYQFAQMLCCSCTFQDSGGYVEIIPADAGQVISTCDPYFTPLCTNNSPQISVQWFKSGTHTIKIHYACNALWGGYTEIRTKTVYVSFDNVADADFTLTANSCPSPYTSFTLVRQEWPSPKNILKNHKIEIFKLNSTGGIISSAAYSTGTVSGTFTIKTVTGLATQVGEKYKVKLTVNTACDTNLPFTSSTIVTIKDCRPLSIYLVNGDLFAEPLFTCPSSPAILNNNTILPSGAPPITNVIITARVTDANCSVVGDIISVQNVSNQSTYDLRTLFPNLLNNVGQFSLTMEAQNALNISNPYIIIPSKSCIKVNAITPAAANFRFLVGTTANCDLSGALDGFAARSQSFTSPAIVGRLSAGLDATLTTGNAITKYRIWVYQSQSSNTDIQIFDSGDVVSSSLPSHYLFNEQVMGSTNASVGIAPTTSFFADNYTVLSNRIFKVKLRVHDPCLFNDVLSYFKLNNNNFCKDGEDEYGFDTEDSFSLYPNPASTYIIIEFDQREDGENGLQLYDLSGKMVKEVFTNKSFSVGHYREIIQISDLTPGI